MSFGWYLARPRGSPIGPLRAEALVRRIRGGSLSPAELVWKEGMSAWRKIAHVAELMGDEVEEEEERAPDTTPETRREPEKAFDEGSPETRPGMVAQAILERARGAPPLAQTAVSPGADSASFSRLFAETPGQPAAVIQTRVDSRDESPPATLSFGSKGMIIVTAPTPVASTLVLSTEARQQAASAWAAEQRAAVPSALRDAASPHTVRMPSAPSRAPYVDIPVTEEAYEQLVAEQEDAPPRSVPPPPYPSNYPAPLVPSQPIPFPLVLPHAPIAPAPQPLGQRVASPQPQRRAFFPATAAGKLLLVFIVFGSLALGFLAARYVVRSRRFPPFVAPVAAAPPSGSSMALSSSASSPVAAPAESAASPAQEPAPSTGAPPSASAPPPGLAPAEALVPAPAPAPASS